MVGKNATPLVGWHPKSPEHLARLEAEVKRRGGGRGVRSDLLDEMLAEWLARHDRPAGPPPLVAAEPPQPRQAVKVKDAPKGKCDHRVQPGSYCKTCRKIKEK